MARYNAWANIRLYKMAGALPDLYRREVGVYSKSPHGTLNHLLVTDRIWMRRLTGEGSHPNKLNAIASTTSLLYKRSARPKICVRQLQRKLARSGHRKGTGLHHPKRNTAKTTHRRNTCALIQSSDTSQRPSAPNFDSPRRHRARPA